MTNIINVSGLSTTTIILLLLLILMIDLQICNVFELNTYWINNSVNKSNDINVSNNKRRVLEQSNLVVGQGSLLLTEICLGYPKQCLNVAIDTGSFMLYVVSNNCSNCTQVKNKYDESKSTTFQNLFVDYDIEYVTGYAKGTFAKEDVYLKSATTQLLFLLAKDIFYEDEFEGILGLGNYYRKDLKYFSFIDQLYYSQAIQTRVFSQQYFTNNKTGILTIGDYPQQIKNDINNYHTCNTVKDNYNKGYWTCNLKSVKIESKMEILITTPVIFDTGCSTMIIPKHLLLKIADSIFKEFIDQHLCILKELENRYLTLLCEKGIMYFKHKLSKIYFIFNNNNFALNYKDYLEYDEDNDVYYFNGVSMLDQSVDWLIGEPLLKSFITVFDKEQQQIGFYGHNAFKVVSKPTSFAATLVYFSFGCFTLVLGCYLIFQLLVYNKVQFHTIFIDYRQRLINAII